MNSMKRLKSAAIPLAAMCLAPLACLAQDSQGTLYRVVTAVVKHGLTAKFEQGVKQVNAYLQSHGDTTSHTTFEVMYGPDEGNIVLLIPFKWEDEDNPPSYADGAGQLVAKSVSPYLSSAHTVLVRELPNLGNPPAANAAVQKYYEVVDLTVKPGKMDDFLAALGQLSAASLKSNPGPNPVLIYRTVAGGDADEITVAIGHPDFADFGRPAGKSNIEVLTEAYGGAAALAIENSLSNSIASVHITIARYRPDLSFTASGQ